MKVHVQYAPQSEMPTYVNITAPNVNDVSDAPNIALEQEATYVFDKGYCDYNWWWKIQQKQAFFVTRAKSNAGVTVTRDLPLSTDSDTILSDQEVKFKNKKPRGGAWNHYTESLRRIVVARPDKETPLVLLTNHI